MADKASKAATEDGSHKDEESAEGVKKVLPTKVKSVAAGRAPNTMDPAYLTEKHKCVV